MQKCPKCGNLVEGDFHGSSYDDLKGGLKTVAKFGIKIGQGLDFIPGGRIIGALLQATSEGIIDIIPDNTYSYTFECHCGYTWRSDTCGFDEKDLNNNIHEYSSDDDNIIDNPRTEILKLIREYSNNQRLNEGCTIAYFDIKMSQLKQKLQSGYGIYISESQMNSCVNVKQLIDLIEEKKQESLMDYDTNQELFAEELKYFMENADSIVNSRENVDKYIVKLSNKMSGCDYVVKSEYHFLQSMCCLRYSLLQNDYASFISIGSYYINKANSLLEDDEYKLVKLMFEQLSLDFEDDNIAELQMKFSQKPCIVNLENTLYKTDYLNELYEDVRFQSLTKSAIQLEKKDNYKDSIKCIELLTHLTNIGYQLLAYSLLCDYFYCGKPGVEVLETKSFMYAAKGYVLVDLEECYDDEYDLHQNWLNCLSHVAYCYYEGEGVEQDYTKAFELLRKAAKLGDVGSMYYLGEMFEDGLGVQPSKQNALQWYEMAAELGDEDAIEKVGKLKK